MSSKFIIPWTEQPAQSSIITWKEKEVLEPESIYPGWMNLVGQRSIRAIAISPKSRHIWMATWGGVLSWREREESTYYRYSSEHGLAGNGVSCLCVDEDERPWVGQAEGGLAYFADNRWQLHPERQTEIFRVVSSADSQSGIWAATDSCLYYISGPAGSPVPFLVDQPGAGYPVALLSDSQDLLVGNNLGLCRVHGPGEIEPVAPDQISSCRSLARDLCGRIWIATAAEIFMMEGGQLSPQPFYDGSAGAVLKVAAARDRIWLLTTGGLSVIDSNGWKLIAPTPEQQNLPTLHTIAASANDNQLWVGTDCLLSSLFYSGDGTLSWGHSLLPTHAEDDLNNLGRCFAASDAGTQNIWIGTAGGLVTYQTDEAWSIDQTKGDVRQLCVSSTANGETVWLLNWPGGFSSLIGSFEQPPGIPIALVRGKDGNAYGLTSRGLWQLGTTMKKIADGPPRRTLHLAQTQDGTWWAGTTDGVYGYAQGIWELAGEQPGPRLSEVYALLAMGNELWAATAAGLWCRRGNVWESHNPPQPRMVRALAPASRAGKVWLAEQEGVMRYSSADMTVDKCYSITTHGLASNRVAALAEIRDELWIVTEAGISRLRLLEEVT
jgi:ligand-binding sensor domain-containing protein